jgi:hypothetical protein
MNRAGAVLLPIERSSAPGADQETLELIQRAAAARVAARSVAERHRTGGAARFELR